MNSKLYKICTKKNRYQKEFLRKPYSFIKSNANNIVNRNLFINILKDHTKDNIFTINPQIYISIF